MGLFGDVVDALPAALTVDFWSRLLFRPLEAVRAMPDVAIRAGAAGAAATLAVAGAITAAPVIASGIGTLFGIGRVAAAPLTFAARNPITSFLLVTQADLPTEIVRAFGASRAAPVPAPVPTTPIPQGQRAFPATPTPRRGPVVAQNTQQMFNSMFGVN